MADDVVFGELLVREKLITRQQLEKAVDFQESLGGELRDVIVKLGFVKENVLSSVVAEQEHVRPVDVEELEVDDELMNKVPRDRIEQYQVLILKDDDGDGSKLSVAMSDPNNVQAIEEIQFLTSRQIEPKVAPKSAIRKAINQYFQRLDGLAPKEEPKDVSKAVKEAPMEALVRAAVLALVEKGVLDGDELLGKLQKLQ